MFEIRTDTFEGIELITLFNTISEEYVSILPSYGGNIHELVLQKENILYDIISSNSSKENLVGTNQNFYRGAKLSPFPNRINKGQYEFEGVAYSLPPNDNAHALHGLIWNKPFEIVDAKKSLESTELILSYSYKKDSDGYPFSYVITISYQLSQDGLTVSTTVLNMSNEAIPIGDGWHPYITTGVDINQLKLKLPSRQKIKTDDSLIPTGEIIQDDSFLELSTIGDQLIDSCFVVDAATKIAETILFDDEQDLNIVLWQQTEGAYPFVHIYTPPDRRSLAIEPASCIPNAFNTKESLDVLQPTEKREYIFGINLR